MLVDMLDLLRTTVDVVRAISVQGWCTQVLRLQGGWDGCLPTLVLEEIEFAPGWGWMARWASLGNQRGWMVTGEQAASTL